MSFRFKKIVASVAAIAVFASSTFPVSALWSPAPADQTGAKGSTQTVAAASGVLKARLKEQSEFLKKTWKTGEYAKASIKWDEASAEPSQIRNLKKKASSDVAKDVKSVFDDLAPLYGVKKPAKKPAIEATGENPSVKGDGRHVRLQQTFSWVEIRGGDLIAHVDSEGNLTQIDGDYVPEVKVSTVPKIKVSKALAPAMAKHSKSKDFKLSNPELAIVSETSGQNLVWSYEASFQEEDGGLSRLLYEVDAETGKVARVTSLVMHADSPSVITGNLLPGEGGANVSLSWTYSGDYGRHFIFDGIDRLTYVYNISTNSGKYVDADDIANRVTNNWGNSDPVEISAGYNLQKTLDFFKPYGFGIRDVEFSDPEQTMAHFVVHYGTNYANAFWSSGQGFYFGDGDGTSMSELATIDIIAHEFGHAWTDNTSNLTYAYEPGALNESFSDIVWATVEILTQADDRASYPNAAAGKGDWLVGEDVLRLPGVTSKSIRDMRNPANRATVWTGSEQPTKYKGTYWYSGDLDYGGVHQNSGVQNFFYYLLAEGGKGNNDGLLYSVDGIGISNAWQVAYATNTNFLTSSSDYQDARQAWIDAANSINPAWGASVANAWDAVGVFEKIDYPAFVSGDASFENRTSLPSGWASVSPVWPWTVTTATGAFGTNSLVSGDIGDSQTTEATYNATTESGYLSFHARTSSEKNFDFLKFYVDGALKWQWSGTNAWMPVTVEIGKGAHEFKWAYVKDASTSAWSDLAGIDAVHLETATGTVDVTSTSGSGNVRSKNGLSAVISMDGTGTYLFEDANLWTIVRGTSSWTVVVPLPNAAEGTNVVRMQYRNSKNFVSSVMERTFFVDSVSPSAFAFVASASSGASQNVDVAWTPTSDTGAGLRSEPYVYEISQTPDFSAVTASGTTSATGTSLTLPEGVSYVKVTAYDIAGNATATPVKTLFVDTVAPDAPANLQLNGDAVIGSGTVASVALTGLAWSGETASHVEYEVSDRNGTTLTGSTTVNGDGSFSATLDLTALHDGMVDYSASVVDTVGNRSAVSLGSVGKSVIPADGTVEFLSGSHVGSNVTQIRISASKNVTFELTWDVTETKTGSVTSGGSVDVPVDLSAGDGDKNVLVAFTDEALSVTYASANVVLDTVAPTLSISSHVDGATAEWTGIALTGSVNDAGGIAAFTVGWAPMPLASGNWTKTLALAEGDNTFEASVSDHVGNVATATVTITRTPVVSNVTAGSVTWSGFVVTFVTDVNATGSVAYGTDSGSLNTVVAWNSYGTTHSVAIIGLSDDAAYSFKAYGTVNGKDGRPSAIGSVKTPKTATSAQYGDEITATWSVTFADSTSTGSDFGSASGTVTIYSEDGKDSVSFALSGTVISTTGWDGIFGAPKPASVSGTISETGYSQTGAVYAIGNDTARLSFSGRTVTVRVDLWNHLNGKTLKVYHSNDGVSFDYVTECVVSSGVCQFEASSFSYYGFAAPSDSTPDSFTFASVNGAELSTETVSESVTLTGFNVPLQIGITGGSYSVNNAAFTTSWSTVSAGDTVRVKVVSASTGSAQASATLSVGTVNAAFTVTTKSVSSGGGSSSSSSSSSSGGGGGGGWAGSSAPTVGSAVKQDKTGTGAQAPESPAKTSKKKKNSVVSAKPMEAASELAKLPAMKKLAKTATAKNVPEGMKPMVDRLVTERIVASLKLEKMNAEAKASALAKASSDVAKLAKSKTNGWERAILLYVSEKLSKKAEDAKKPAKKKNVRKPAAIK